MNVYYLPNLDGTFSALVAARNQREACELMGSSVYSFKDYGGCRTTDPVLVAVAMTAPGVWYKRLYHGPGRMPWGQRVAFSTAAANWRG